MRGLKRTGTDFIENMQMSHLLQMRGLKRQYAKEDQYPIYVASFTDAWIETRLRK